MDHPTHEKRVVFDRNHDMLVKAVAERTSYPDELLHYAETLRAVGESGNRRSIVPIIDGLMLASKTRNSEAMRALSSSLNDMRDFAQLNQRDIGLIVSAWDHAERNEYDGMREALLDAGIRAKWSKLTRSDIAS